MTTAGDLSLDELAEIIGFARSYVKGGKLLSVFPEGEKKVARAQAWLEKLKEIEANPDGVSALALGVLQSSGLVVTGLELADSTLPVMRRFLDLSTGHISEATCNFLNLQYQIGSPVCIVDQHGPDGEHGYWVWVTGEDSPAFEKLPPDLRAVMSYARVRQCDWICFDRDAPQLPGLPFFDW